MFKRFFIGLVLLPFLPLIGAALLAHELGTQLLDAWEFRKRIRRVSAATQPAPPDQL